MTTYRALTVWQPWASLIAAGAKPYEWRAWPAPERMIGQRIAIHAGARPPKRVEIKHLLHLIELDGAEGTSLDIDIAKPLLERWMMAPGMLPLSSVLCLATLGQPITAASYAKGRGVADSDRINQIQWGWPLTDIEGLQPFVPASGAQGFWMWTDPR